MTSDIDQRWSSAANNVQVHPKDESFLAEWLPGKGGTVYSAGMDVFFQLFYQYPQAPWRYALGYEPGLMTDDNYVVVQSIRDQGYRSQTVRPWVTKMSAADRLVVTSDSKPDLPDLEWARYNNQMWFGRIAISSGTVTMSSAPK